MKSTVKQPSIPISFGMGGFKKVTSNIRSQGSNSFVPTPASGAERSPKTRMGTPSAPLGVGTGSKRKGPGY